MSLEASAKTSVQQECRSGFLSFLAMEPFARSNRPPEACSPCFDWSRIVCTPAIIK